MTSNPKTHRFKPHNPPLLGCYVWALEQLSNVKSFLLDPWARFLKLCISVATYRLGESNWQRFDREPDRRTRKSSVRRPDSGEIRTNDLLTTGPRGAAGSCLTSHVRASIRIIGSLMKTDVHQLWVITTDGTASVSQGYGTDGWRRSGRVLACNPPRAGRARHTRGLWCNRKKRNLFPEVTLIRDWKLSCVCVSVPCDRLATYSGVSCMHPVDLGSVKLDTRWTDGWFDTTLEI